MADEKQRTPKSLALTDERHGRLQRAWDSPAAFKIAAGFLLVVVALGIWVVASGKPGTSSPAPTAAASPPAQQQITTAASTPATTTAITTSSTSCTLPAGDQSVPSQAAPSGVTWGQIGSMSVPQAPQTYGPQHDDGTWAWCFAHNPTGALMAGYNFWGEGTAARPAQVYERYAADTPTRAKAIASVAGAPAGLEGPGPVQVIGYRYESYTSTNADFALLFQGPQGGCLGVSFDMTWQGGDWRYVIPPPPTPAMQRVACTTSDYVQWGGLS